jgi:glycerophosphoryl diester phosphodiesterase
MKIKTKVITHRGLNPDTKGFPPESSAEAFASFLKQGYGLEFDVRFTVDKKMIAIHDASLKRLTKGKDERQIADISGRQILAMDFNGNHLISIPQLLVLIHTLGAPDSLSALHLKSANQKPELLDILIPELRVLDPKKFIIFDPTIEMARYIHAKNPDLQLAASVSHPYDIERFNKSAGGTLITMEQLLDNKDVFTWAWLDEWDRRDVGGKTKSLLNSETFGKLRDHNIGIALVTPELHSTSPSQPTGVRPEDLHEDASTRERLDTILEHIVSLKPDGMCTDHPDFVNALINTNSI